MRAPADLAGQGHGAGRARARSQWPTGVIQRGGRSQNRPGDCFPDDSLPVWFDGEASVRVAISTDQAKVRHGFGAPWRGGGLTRILSMACPAARTRCETLKATQRPGRLRRTYSARLAPCVFGAMCLSRPGKPGPDITPEAGSELHQVSGERGISCWCQTSAKTPRDHPDKQGRNHRPSQTSGQVADRTKRRHPDRHDANRRDRRALRQPRIAANAGHAPAEENPGPGRQPVKPATRPTMPNAKVKPIAASTAPVTPSRDDPPCPGGPLVQRHQMDHRKPDQPTTRKARPKAEAGLAGLPSLSGMAVTPRRF